MAAAVGVPVIMPMLCERRRGLGLSLADLAPRASSDAQLSVLGPDAFQYGTFHEDLQGQQPESNLAASEGQRRASVAPHANVFDEVHTMVSQLLQQIRAETTTTALQEEVAEEEARWQHQRKARDRFRYATSRSVPSVGSPITKRSSGRRKSCPSCGGPGHLSADQHTVTSPPRQQHQHFCATAPATPWDRRRLRRAMSQPDLEASKPRLRTSVSAAGPRERWMQMLRDSGHASSFCESQEFFREAARPRVPRRPSQSLGHPDKVSLSYSSDMGEHRESVRKASGCGKDTVSIEEEALRLREHEEAIRKLHREESMRRKQRAEAKKRRDELKRRDEQARRQREELTKFLEEEALRMQREARREELEARRARREETKKKEQEARRAREAEEKARRKREAAEKAEWRQRLEEEEAKSVAAATAAAERRLLQEEATASEHRRRQHEGACYRRQLREEDARRRRRRRQRRGPEMDAAERRRKLVSQTAFQVASGAPGQEQGVRLLSSSRRFDVHLPEVLTKVEEDEEEEDEDEEDEEAQLDKECAADVMLNPERHMARSATGTPAWGLDQATLELEALVEQSHQALIRDGLLDPSVGGEAGGMGVSIPSLDAVDRALEELQRGLAEIDSALAKPSM